MHRIPLRLTWLPLSADFFPFPKLKEQLAGQNQSSEPPVEGILGKLSRGAISYVGKQHEYIGQ